MNTENIHKNLDSMQELLEALFEGNTNPPEEYNKIKEEIRKAKIVNSYNPAENIKMHLNELFTKHPLDKEHEEEIIGTFNQHIEALEKEYPSNENSNTIDEDVETLDM